MSDQPTISDALAREFGHKIPADFRTFFDDFTGEAEGTARHYHSGGSSIWMKLYFGENLLQIQRAFKRWLKHGKMKPMIIIGADADNRKILYNTRDSAIYGLHREDSMDGDDFAEKKLADSLREFLDNSKVVSSRG